MYDFQSTDPAMDDRIPLSAESLSYNGKYLENEVPGFRTLSVSGRGILSKEITDKSRDGFDGSSYIRRTIPPREITVAYRLTAPSASELINRVNILNAVLSDDQVPVVFADEPDKHFIGSAFNGSDPEPGRLAFTGEIQIRCTDPYKYLSVQKEIPVSIGRRGTLTIPNGGNADAILRYDLQFTQPNGYIGVSSAYGGMEFGNIDSVYKEAVSNGTETLLSKAHVLKNWPAAAGYHHSVKTVSVAPDMIPTNSERPGVRKWITGEYSGNAHAAGEFCRAAFEIDVPRDSTQQSGKGGAESFYVSLFHWFQSAFADETGYQAISFIDTETTDGSEIARLELIKAGVNNQASYNIMVDGHDVRRFDFECNHESPFSAGQRGYNDFLKDGATFRYHFNGKYYTYVNRYVEHRICNKIRFEFGHYPGDKPLTRNYIGDFRFDKKRITGDRLHPVVFPASSKVTIDGSHGKFLLDGMYKPEHEIIGSRYFRIPPGNSRVNLTASSWYEGRIIGTIYVQERWL